MTRIRLTAAYDGTEFSGWQAQPGARTVAGRLNELLATIYQAPIEIAGSSRTDGGVHATGQTAHYDAPSEVRPAKVERSLNAMARGEIAVRDLAPAVPGFHARHDARWRRYRFRLLVSTVPDPLTGRYRLQVPFALDREAMEEALVCLPGERDFSAFRSAHCGAEHARRRILEARLESRGERLDLVIAANAFLHQMVRIIAGTLVEVGRGRLTPAGMAEVLAGGDRRRAGPTLPPGGLCLEQVGYGPFPDPGSDGRADASAAGRTPACEADRPGEAPAP